MKIRLARALVLGAAMVMLTVPAGADIQSFNAAMQSGDYKTAAAAAASAWPGLSQSREDIAIIAREFGFAAYMAGDFAAARTYGQAAVSAGETLGEDAQSRATSEILLRLAEHRIGPTQASRGRLFAALQARAGSPNLDLISYFAADTVSAYDMEAGNWEDAAASARLAESLTVHGGADFRVMHFRFAILAAAARYLVGEDMSGVVGMSSVVDRLVEASGSASDGELAALKPLYFEASAWSATIEAHFRKRDEAALNAWREQPDPQHETEIYKAGRARLKPPGAEGVCKVVMSERSAFPMIPTESKFRGMTNTVIMLLDVGANGKTSNPRLLASAPVKAFGEAMLKKSPVYTYERAKDAAPGCTLAQKDVQLTIVATSR